MYALTPQPFPSAARPAPATPAPPFPRQAPAPNLQDLGPALVALAKAMARTHLALEAAPPNTPKGPTP
jgi:hypothetical protein